MQGRWWVAARPWVGTAARLILGAVFVVAGATKVDDLAASGRAVVAYRILPYDVASLVGTVLPFVEIALGLLLIFGLATRFVGVFSAFLLVVFIGAVASVWARGLRIDCGCFGQGGDLAAGAQPQYFSETIRDIALLILSALLMVVPRTRLSLDSRIVVETRTADAGPADAGPADAEPADARAVDARAAQTRVREGGSSGE